MPAALKTAPTDASDESNSACPADPDPDQPPGPGERTHPTLELVDADHRLIDADRRWLSHRAAEALATLRPDGPGGDVRVRIVDDHEMSRMHLRHMDDASTTDVLTFDLSGDAEAPLDVDILICADEAARQAQARGGNWLHELLLYIIHGTLHCLGFDDVDDAGAARMHRKEDEVLCAIGVGAVYSRGESREGGS